MTPSGVQFDIAGFLTDRKRGNGSRSPVEVNVTGFAALGLRSKAVGFCWYCSLSI